MQRAHELPRDRADLALGQAAVGLEHLEELALRKLGDDAHLGVGLEVVEHQHDVLVAQRAQDLDLLPQRRVVLLRPAALRDELERDDLPGVAPPTLVHLAERALADDRLDVVILHRRAAVAQAQLRVAHFTGRATGGGKPQDFATQTSRPR